MKAKRIVANKDKPAETKNLLVIQLDNSNVGKKILSFISGQEVGIVRHG